MILEEVEEYCSRVLVCSRCAELPFHNIRHTMEVVENVDAIGHGMGLTNEELELVLIAAWFHDTGFCDLYHGHELLSAMLAKEFLKSKKYSTAKIEIVTSCIEATQMPQAPKNQYAEILCDADVFHISNQNFFYRKLLLRREWEIHLSRIYTDKEWHELNLDFLKKHKFFTSYGKDKLENSQHSNENKVREILKYY